MGKRKTIIKTIIATIVVIFAVIAVIMGANFVDGNEGKIVGRVVIDNNRNWAVDTHDQAVEGLVVKLYKKTTPSQIWETVEKVEVKDGKYKFLNVRAGEYLLKVVEQIPPYQLPYWVFIVGNETVEVGGGETVLGPTILLVPRGLG